MSAGIPQLLQHVHKHATRNDPLSVLAAINDYSEKEYCLMTVGDEKGQSLRKVLNETKDVKVHTYRLSTAQIKSISY